MCWKSDTPKPSQSGTGTCPPGSTAPCPLQCPAMEIEINNTSTADDDVVQLRCTHPVGRKRVSCRIRVTAAPAAQATTVVLTNPDGRLRFPTAGDASTTVTVPADGSWAAFEISGETASAALNDAVIEAHCNTATGATLATKNVTVFSFDQARMELVQGGNYAFTNGTYTVTGARAVSYRSRARIRPAGVSCAAPQVSRLRIGIVQESRLYRHAVTWGNPTITWRPGVAVGTSVTVPRTIRQSVAYDPAVPLPVADSEASVAPLYDQPGKAGTLDPDSLQLPIGCQPVAGTASATSFDTPSHAAPPMAEQDVSSGGVVVGRVRWTRINSTRDEEFRAFCVAFDTSDNSYCALRQGDWEIHIDSAGPAADQHATVHADVDATTNPATGASANDVAHTQGTAAVGATTTTFTR